MDPLWLPDQALTASARYRLFCFPCAGGSAAAYRPWQRAMPGHIQVCPVELPGRGARLGETPVASLPLLVRELVASLAGALDEPFAFFGHSMGGLVAFELARGLREHGMAQPAHVFISSTTAPGAPGRRRLVHDAPECEIRQHLRTLNGTPEELLTDDELMALVMPVLRADFAVLETYEYEAGEPLGVPLSVFGGRYDPVVSPADLAPWSEQSSVGTRFRLFPGDHFYLNTAVGALAG